MRLGVATLVASCALSFACASPDDDSWSGAAADETALGGTTEGGGGSSMNVGGWGGGGGAPPMNHPTNTVTSNTTTTTQTTSTGATMTCDAGSCDSCQQCAMSGACSGAIDACFADQSCNALLGCMSDCVDEICAQTCADENPSGMALYTAAGECVFCEECPLSCGAC